MSVGEDMKKDFKQLNGRGQTYPVILPVVWMHETKIEQKLLALRSCFVLRREKSVKKSNSSSMKKGLPFAAERRRAFTLIEIMVTVAVIGILVSITMTTAGHLDKLFKIKRTENTFALVNAALAEFQDYGYRYRDADLAKFSFPLDCNGFNLSDFKDTMLDAFRADVIDINEPPLYEQKTVGIETMYLFLDMIPESKKILSKIDPELLELGYKIVVVHGAVKKEYPTKMLKDPWKEPLRYDYYNVTFPIDYGDWFDTRRTFPILISAGPDKQFNTPDDITSE